MLQLLFDLMDIIDSVSLIVTKDQGLIKLCKHSVILHYWKIQQQNCAWINQINTKFLAL